MEIKNNNEQGTSQFTKYKRSSSKTMKNTMVIKQSKTLFRITKHQKTWKLNNSQNNKIIKKEEQKV